MASPGGGGSSGTIDYPTYMKDFHGAILFGGDPDGSPPIADFTAWGNVADDMVAARSAYGGSPYALVEAYDPSADIDAIQAKYDDWDDLLDELNHIEDIEDIVDAAVAKSTALVPSSEIDDVVNAFEARSKSAYLRNVSRVATGMFDIGAVMSSQFGMALSQMEVDRQEQVNDVDARLRLMAERERYQSTNAIMSDMVKILLFKIENKRAGVGGQMDISRFNVIASQDQLDKDLTLEVKDAQWDLDLWNYPQGVMSSIAGAATVPRPQTQGERLAAAFGTSTSFGLQAGTVLGSPRAGLVAGVGSLAVQLLTGAIE